MRGVWHSMRGGVAQHKGVWHSIREGVAQHKGVWHSRRGGVVHSMRGGVLWLTVSSKFEVALWNDMKGRETLLLCH